MSAAGLQQPGLRAESLRAAAARLIRHGALPLLPAQQALAERLHANAEFTCAHDTAEFALEREIRGLRWAGVAYQQPLRHRAFARSRCGYFKSSTEFAP